MPINLGSGAISAAYVGTNAVTAAYLGSSSVFAAGGGGLSDPSTISGLQVWIDASDSSTVTISNGFIQYISDKSSNAFQFDEKNLTYYPGQYGATVNSASQNSLDTWYFDNDGYNINSGFVPYVPNCTIFFVASTTSGTNDYWIGGNASGIRPAILSGYDVTSSGQAQGFEWYGMVAGEIRTFGNQSSMTGPQLLTVTRSQPGSTTLYLDGTQVATATADTTPTTSDGFTKIGYGGGAVTGATFCEWLVYNSVLSSSDQQAVEGYLRNKWGL
jgi:hypothetical protein